MEINICDYVPMKYVIASKLLRVQTLLVPAMIMVAVGAFAFELVSGIECCPIRDWALRCAGMTYHCHHESGHHHE
jgi:hypothetical protein